MSALTKTYNEAPAGLFLGFDHFSVDYSLSTVFLTIKFATSITHTNHLPLTKDILDKLLPSIYLQECLNNQQLPFQIEVKNTEIGHLFEHIILEYLYLEKISIGDKNFVYFGETSWNWLKEARGTFHISISLKKEDRYLLPKAIEKASYLMNLILTSAPLTEESNQSLLTYQEQIEL